MRFHPILGQVTGYKYVSSCKVCSAKDRQGNLLRPILEGMEVQSYHIQGKSNRQMQREFLATHGINVYISGLSHHYTRHAPYLKDQEIQRKITTKVKTIISHQNIESRTVLQNVINHAGEMIENWWRSVHGEVIDGPQMPITERLTVEALKEEGRRAPRTAIDQELDLFEKQMIEGEKIHELPNPN